MTIEALALLRLARDSLPEAAQARVVALEDGLLLRTGEPFSRAPEELSVAVRALIGPLLEQSHDDARGIFFVPDVAAPTSKTYEQVVAEVGEGGVWGPLVDAPALPDGAEGLGALLGNLLSQLPPSLLASANAAAAGDPRALESMGAQLQGMLGSPALSGLAAQVGSMLESSARTPPSADAPLPAELGSLFEGTGIDLGSPAFQQLAADVRAQLERDPSTVAAFAERFLGKDDADGGDEKK